jgi:hypothetical protein
MEMNEESILAWNIIEKTNANLFLTEKGLGTCWVCNYDTAKMQQFFPREGYEAVVIIPVGHIAEACLTSGFRASIPVYCTRNLSDTAIRLFSTTCSF